MKLYAISFATILMMTASMQAMDEKKFANNDNTPTGKSEFQARSLQCKRESLALKTHVEQKNNMILEAGQGMMTILVNILNALPEGEEKEECKAFLATDLAKDDDEDTKIMRTMLEGAAKEQNVNLDFLNPKDNKEQNVNLDFLNPKDNAESSSSNITKLFDTLNKLNKQIEALNNEKAEVHLNILQTIQTLPTEDEKNQSLQILAKTLYSSK